MMNMKKTTAMLLAAGLFTAAPLFASADAEKKPDADKAPTLEKTAEIKPGAPDKKLGKEAETDIMVDPLTGLPVNQDLAKKIMESKEARSVNDLLELSHKVLNDQKEKLAKDRIKQDMAWMKQDPFGHLEGEMSEQVSRIDESDTDKTTQQRGEDIVRKMDGLIAMMEKACSACSACAGGAPGNQPGKMANGKSPAKESNLTPGQKGDGALSATGSGNNKYKDLDPKQREAILRAKEDQKGLPKEFEKMLDEYYRRLASDDSLTSDEPEASGDGS